MNHDRALKLEKLSRAIGVGPTLQLAREASMEAALPGLDPRLLSNEEVDEVIQTVARASGPAVSFGLGRARRPVCLACLAVVDAK